MTRAGEQQTVGARRGPPSPPAPVDRPGQRGNDPTTHPTAHSTTHASARPLVAVLAGVVATVVAALVLRRDDWLLTSDSVAQQSIVRTWFAAGHDRTFLPPDTWLLKLPVYGVVEALPLAPATRVLVEAVALAVLLVLALAWALTRLARQAGLPTLPALTVLPLALFAPLAWLATLSGGIGSYLVALPNSRNVELGLALVVVATAGGWLRPARAPAPRRRRGWVAVAALAAVAVLLPAVLWVDDPYGAFLVGFPLALAALAWWLRPAASGGRDRRLLVVAAVLLASVGAVFPLRWALGLAGVVVVPDATGPTTDAGQFVAHLSVLGPSAAAQLGLGEPGAVAGVAHALAVTVSVLGAVGAAAVVWQGWRRGSLALAFVGVHAVVVVAGVLANKTVSDFHAGRYLVLGFVDLAVCLGLGSALLLAGRGRRARAAGAVAVGVVLAATAANLAAAAVDAPVPPGRVRAQRAEQQAVLRLLRDAVAEGATKGVGPFWTADLFTHLSGGAVLVSDVTCRGGVLSRREWLTDSARLAEESRGSFVIVPGTGELGCSAEQVVRHAGERPRQRWVTPGGTVVLVFDGDVTARVMPAGAP